MTIRRLPNFSQLMKTTAVLVAVAALSACAVTPGPAYVSGGVAVGPSSVYVEPAPYYYPRPAPYFYPRPAPYYYPRPAPYYNKPWPGPHYRPYVPPPRYPRPAPYYRGG
jgi:hypothetical protein